jgi:hypothetical protein
MTVRTWATPACVVICGFLSIGACGGPASGGISSRAEEAQVKRFLPAAHDIRCNPSRDRVTRCQALVSRGLAGTERWECEFTVETVPEQQLYSGMQSCWSDNGRRESLRLPIN